MIRHRLNKLTHVANSIGRRIGLPSSKRRRTIIRFAEKLGFVYFGTVDQYHDEHRIIRGLTVSSTHQDDNYSVGSFDTYDVSLVDRTDATESRTGKLVTRNWVILEIDLHTSFDVPHTFLAPHSRIEGSYAHLFSAMNSLLPVSLGTFETYSPEFTKRYGIYTSPSHYIEIERLFTAEVSQSIAAHFWPLAVEIYEGSLFIYSDDKVLSPHLLEMMVKNGIWLATVIDSMASRI